MRVFVLFCLAVLAFATAIPEQRPGVCPTDVVTEAVYGMCNEYDTCETDQSCTEDQVHKCCGTSCGRRCIAPVVSETDEEEETKTREEITELLSTILSNRYDLVKKLDKYPPPLVRFIVMKNRTDVVRVCVTTPCEMRKCQRIAQAMTYKITPRKEWFCQLATSTEQCLFWAERGWTDTVMARENKIFIAKDQFNVTSFAYEMKSDAPTEIEKKVQNITLAVTLVNTDINTFSQLNGRRICSAGVNMTASFLTPVCNLIYKGVMIPTGNLVESSADFFRELCVPGIMNKTYNKNGTFPENLITGCHHMENEYTGVKGSIMCMANGHGDVTFVDNKVVKYLDFVLPDQFKLVCEDESLPLSEWEQTKCHLGYTPRPVMFLNPERNDTYKAELREINEKSAEVITASESSDYICLKQPNRDLIFMDENTNLEFVNDSLSIPTVQEYLQAFNVCHALTPKPRSKICTVGPVQYQNCLTMKSVFEKDIDLKNISWGCVLAKTEMDCMRNVLNGTADLYSGDVKEIFIAGNDFKLKPIVILNEQLRFEKSDLRNATVKSHTIAVMKKSKLWEKFGQDAKFVNIRNLTVCSPDILSVPNFHLPIGHLLSTGVIPRIGSVFESVNRFYKSVCLPGASPEEFRWDTDLILGHEVNWGIPGLSFYNFTGFDWFIWNSPHTWNFYNYNHKTPGTLKNFMQKRLLVPLLEGKLTVPEEFNPDTFDYSILDDVLSMEGLGDILNDIPDEIRDSLVDTRNKRVDRKERFGELYEEKTGDEFISPKDRHLGKLISHGFSQQSFQNMEDEWGLFDDVNAPVMTSEKIGRTMTGGKVSNFRDIIDGVNAGDNTATGNFLQNYDSEYTVPVIARIFSQLLKKKFDKLSVMAKTAEILHHVPTMTGINGQDYEWLKHPAVQAYIRIYAPRLASYYSDLYDNVEVSKIQSSRYINPIWLSPSFKDFLDITKLHMTELTKSCRGYGDHKGVGSTHEPFYGTEGVLMCIEDNEEGDIAFIDTESFAQLANPTEYVMITPAGLVQTISNDTILNGSYGFTPFPAIMTAFNKTGSWRWNITKGLLIAQKKYPVNTTTAYSIFGVKSVFMPKTKKMIPIPLHMQSHPAYLRIKLNRAFEAIIKPSTHDQWKERRHICSGETFTNVITQNNGTCSAIVSDVTCTGLPRPKVVSVGLTENKQPVVVRMCSRPTRFIQEMAEFTCDNGHGYVTPVVIPTTCQCVPCEEIKYISEWTTDRVWREDVGKHAYEYMKGINSARTLMVVTKLHRAAPSSDAVKEICFDGVGCFNDILPCHSTGFPPSHPDIIQTQFFLYTRANTADPDRLEIGDNDTFHRFDPRKDIKVVVHGFLNDYTTSFIQDIKDALLKADDANVIVVGWHGGATDIYHMSRLNTMVVGKQTANLLMYLRNTFSTLMNIHVIGHSLGAHVAGYVGEDTGFVDRITGLDPAGVLFTDDINNCRLEATDASFVDVIHSNSDAIFGVGLDVQLGHVDFYPNGGKYMPGCIWHVIPHEIALCNHLRSIYYFVGSIQNRDRCLFTAYPCSSWDEFTDGRCSTDCSIEGTCAEMGYYVKRDQAVGKYFLRTTSFEPYCEA